MSQMLSQCPELRTRRNETGPARRDSPHQEEDGEKGSCPVQPSHVPSGVLGWLQSLPDAEPAIYGDTKARVKEKGRGCLLTASG